MFRLMSISAISLFSLFFSVSVASAKVVINEFSSNTSSDWVELYSSEDVDISGWVLKDDKSEIETVPVDTILSASTSAYFALNVSNRLNKVGDNVRLYKPDGSTIVDEIAYGEAGEVCLPGDAGSIGRYPDGNSTIERFSNHTKGGANSFGSIDSCPAPTPEPTSKPTSTPKPTATSKPTATPTLRKSFTPTPRVLSQQKTKTSNNQIDLEGGNSNSDVLGLRNKMKPTENDVELGDGSKGDRRGNFPWESTLFILSGGGFIGSGVYLYKKYQKESSGEKKTESAGKGFKLD